MAHSRRQSKNMNCLLSPAQEKKQANPPHILRGAAARAARSPPEPRELCAMTRSAKYGGVRVRASFLLP